MLGLSLPLSSISHFLTSLTHSKVNNNAWPKPFTISLLSVIMMNSLMTLLVTAKLCNVN